MTIEFVIRMLNQMSSGNVSEGVRQVKKLPPDVRQELFELPENDKRLSATMQMAIKTCKDADVQDEEIQTMAQRAEDEFEDRR